jgi:hypothetical protein
MTSIEASRRPVDIAERGGTCRDKLPTYLRYAGLALIVLAIIFAFAGMESKFGESSHMNPEAAIAFAVAAFACFRGSELKW